MDVHNPKLTVLVTTYNRKSYLERIVDIFSGYIGKGLCFTLLISDDGSTDGTETYCRQLTDANPWITYSRQEKNGGMDSNFRNAYINCKTPYCWLLGDHRYVDYEGLKSILAALDNGDCDALILKCRDEIPFSDTKYDDIHKLFHDLGYNITNNASCVIPTAFFNDILYKRYKGTTFLHMAIFLENISQMQPFKVLYMSNVTVRKIAVPGISDDSWDKHPFMNFGRLWADFIYSLPPCLSAMEKRHVMRYHNSRTGLFGIRRLMGFRLKYGDTFVKSYKDNRQYMRIVSTTPLWLFDLALVWLPTGILKSLHSLYRLTKQKTGRD